LLRTTSALILSCAFTIGVVLRGIMSTATPAGASITVPPTVTASSWTAVSTPTAPQPVALSLNGVAWATSDFCVAVGQQGELSTGTLIEQWDGSSWTLVPGAAPNQVAILDGVSCAGPSFCVAVGATGSGALIETWNGSTWSVGVPA